MEESQYLNTPVGGDDPRSGYRPTVIHSLQQWGVPFEAGRAGGLTAGRILLHMLLFAITILTTFTVGALWFGEGKHIGEAIASGAVYSFTIVMILGAHEMGHYIAARWYGVEATLPYFIPMPLPPVGTFGAFIKIQSPIPNKRALFDIGIAGPLAGFVFAVPAAFIAHYFAQPAPQIAATDGGVIIFQDPLLFKFFIYIFKLPQTIELNPVMWAAWVGVFMTSLNLLPVGQLDGGHVSYAVFGRRGHRFIALACYLAVILLAAYSVRSGLWNWVVYAAILTLMIRIGHPPVEDESIELGAVRKLVAIIGLLVFILSFMPFPISFG